MTVVEINVVRIFVLQLAQMDKQQLRQIQQIVYENMGFRLSK